MHHREQTIVAIHQGVASVLQRYIEDPRLQTITVTEVKLSRKLDYADISITQLDARFTQMETLESLKKAASKIRYYLAKQRTHARSTPKLRFHYDTLLTKKIQLHQLINHVINLH